MVDRAEPFKVVSVAEMRALEQRAFAAGVSERALQEQAARAVARVAAELLGPPSVGAVVGLVGPGNNGRDAMLAVRELARARYPARLFLAPRHAVEPAELAELDRLGVPARALGGDADLALLRRWLDGAALALDGLLGIGARGGLREPLDRIAAALNAARAARAGALRVVAVDVPSGIDADSGAVPGTAVAADVTVALGAVKAGTLRFPAAALAGELRPAGIGLPPGATAALPVALLDAAQVEPLRPARPLDAHKGSLGWVLVVGGSRQYVGAPVLAGLAAARSGCGLVGLAVPRHVQIAAAARFPEATYVLLPGEGAEQDPDGAIAAVGAALERYDAAVLGPGLGRSIGARRLVEAVGAAARAAGRPRLVVDADALNALAETPAWWQRLPPSSVLTPHHGEMGRLAGLAPAAVAAQNWELARERAAAWGQVVVLKGPFTTVAEPGGQAWVNPRANPALATAGTGDVLAGLIAGLLAQGLEPAAAARLGVWTHSQAALLAQRRSGAASLLASDLLGPIARALTGAGCGVRAPHRD